MAEDRRHVVIFSRKAIFVEDEAAQALLNREIDALANYDLYFTSHEDPSEEMLDKLPRRMQNYDSFKRRGPELRAFINASFSNGDVVIICGAVDEDLHVAASTKSFLIAAGWVNPEPEEKVKKYGIPAPTPSKMRTLIDIIVNQTTWYYLCTFNDPVPTKVVSLCLSNKYGVSEEEKSMAEGFQAILKDGNNNPVIKQALICYLMAAIAHDGDFREVQDWAVAPSSSTEPSNIMKDLKEHVRFMMNGRKPEPIFVRHTPTSKSRHDTQLVRQDINYCLKHFQSIRVNDKYKGKLKGRVVCVFDDYLTQGNTFETLRNLLVECKVKKIIFVSIGKFKRTYEDKYIQKSFLIEGDVHTAEYKAKFSTAVQHNVKFDSGAQRSLSNLNNLAKYLQ